jgi:hypothetical protein
MFNSRLHYGMGTDIPGVKGTAYWPLQAVLEMADHDMPKEDTDRAEYVMFGTGADFKQTAWDKCFELVKVRQ